jgi:hypothetical protein
MRYWGQVVIAFSICFQVATQVTADERATPVELSTAQLETVQESVRNDLKDPDSARFGGTVAGTSSQGKVTVCGWVNAKNSYGGYAGKQPFYGSFKSDQSFVTVEIGGNALNFCEKRGLYPVMD